MANRNPRKFEIIKSQEEADASLIPSPRAPISGGAVEAARSIIDYGYGQWDMAAIQMQMKESGKTQRVRSQWVGLSNTSNGTFWVADDGISTYQSNMADLPVHEKMKGKPRPYAAELEVHWKRAKKLGLNAQAEAIEKMALKQDIQELTKGAGYPEVTDQDLETMFEFPRLRKKVRAHNLMMIPKKIAAWFLADNIPGKIVLRLKKDTVQNSGVAIPFGAQLRLEEAKETGFFTGGFQVVYPNVVTEAQLAAERARERDPALVGLFEGSMFLICSWDLPADIKRAEADMDALKALKIEG